MDLVPPTSPSVITVALPRERTNAKKSAMLRPKCHKIKAEFLLMQRCASDMHKKEKDTQFLPTCILRTKETGSGWPYPNITAIIKACPLTQQFVTVKGMSTQEFIQYIQNSK